MGGEVTGEIMGWHSQAGAPRVKGRMGESRQWLEPARAKQPGSGSELEAATATNGVRVWACLAGEAVPTLRLWSGSYGGHPGRCISTVPSAVTGQGGERCRK